jgi:hypothetical protein
MGTAGPAHKVNLVIGLLAGDIARLDSSRADLERLFGRIDLASPVTEFTHTAYYEKEMGPKLKRQYLSFDRLRSLKGIFALKLRTNAIERRRSQGGARTVNIDPGYLDLGKLVLFSTKDYSHRIYLDKGIFAEVTLFYKDKSYNTWPWTYPDYRSSQAIGFFNSVRSLYKAKIC